LSFKERKAKKHWQLKNERWKKNCHTKKERRRRLIDKEKEKQKDCHTKKERRGKKG